ncbi:alcohol dehydrogenase catalytic domain-containing protein [Rodentibacter haemolyticus]|uniref:Alcohol dehydrogenase catalytic domain-containing protein n=1 Tax=Rodentibacter haemolyticus TaxID=2778911 RepID=A0ABX6UVS7_9PAST|nr:alcohol dehydrogenase catalytic domain-containing protein [Rodentibacter haemolyticus]QPB41917.1 alcohol dehydrogenase catalytic domain-containing protein [Rodentibacter haemolyticus]
MKTYIAFQAIDDELKEVRLPIPTPESEQVLIKVEACGICGADKSDVANAKVPRVVGHEVIGRIVAVGENMPKRWFVGQRVGVGRLGGHCNECDTCRSGAFNLCPHQAIIGATADGGYAEYMLARHTGLVSVPNELDAVQSAPLLCAGLATFNALKKSGAEAGDLVAIVGVGGLGHLAVQYAAKMGFEVVAIGRKPELAEHIKALGGDHYFTGDDVVQQLQNLGGAKAIISTINHADTVAEIAKALAPQGKLVILGADKTPLALSIGQLVGGERSVIGSLTGTPLENEKTLKFSRLSHIQAQIERYPLSQAKTAFERMRDGEVRFRAVLEMR